MICDGTAAPEVVGVGGFVVPIDDCSAAADWMIRILRDDTLAMEASERAWRNARRFEWSKVSAPLVTSLKTVAERLDSA